MNAQVDFFPIYEVPKTRIFTIQELDVLANNLGEAYEQTIKQSGLARKQIASLTGIHAETLSMMCQVLATVQRQNNRHFTRLVRMFLPFNGSSGIGLELIFLGSYQQKRRPSFGIANTGMLVSGLV